MALSDEKTGDLDGRAGRGGQGQVPGNGGARGNNSRHERLAVGGRGAAHQKKLDLPTRDVQARRPLGESDAVRKLFKKSACGGRQGGGQGGLHGGKKKFLPSR